MIWAAPTSADPVISAVQHILVLATTIGIGSIYWYWRQLLVLAAYIGLGDNYWYWPQILVLATAVRSWRPQARQGEKRPEEENRPEGHILSKEFTYNSWH